MSAEIEGLPLADLGIESMWVINPRTGEILYELTGFAWPVETGLARSPSPGNPSRLRPCRAWHQQVNPQIAEILYHRYLYYVLCNPEISDAAYDALECQLTPEQRYEIGVGSSLESSYPTEIVDRVHGLKKQSKTG